MAKLRHIAIRTRDPEKTAAWYQEVFGLEEVGRARSGVYLTDGNLNIAVLLTNTETTRGEVAPGFHHFGFLVETSTRPARSSPRRAPSACPARPRRATTSR